jgi:hypothetical protein
MGGLVAVQDSADAPASVLELLPEPLQSDLALNWPTQ